MGDTEVIKKRENWGGRAAFILAAIGSAVGLGNLWGFPYKLYDNGGGAFLVPYFIAMIVLGLPLLIMEFAVGHWAQNSPPGAFGRVFRRYRFVGWWLTALAFVIIIYYTVVLAYCNIFLWESLHALFTGSALPWAANATQAKDHFFTDTIAFDGSMSLGWPLLPVLIGNAISWVLIYLCLFRGVKWVSKVVLITVPLPWFMLVILTIRGLTLEGAQEGLAFFLQPDWSKLGNADTWRAAFGQVFFSLSLGFAVMLSYASFLHRKSDLNNNAAIIALGDLATSFIAGLAVFGTMGAMATKVGQPVDQVVSDGLGLAFVSFPYALAELGAGAAAFSAVFFIALLTLGIDSAFSIVEAVQASVNDNKRPSWRGRWTLPTICTVGLLLGTVFTCSRGGLRWLGLVDDLINGPLGILSVALAECLVVGWAWKGSFVKTMRDHANERSDWRLGPWWDLVIRYLAPILLIILICWSTSDWVAAGKWPHLIGCAVLMAIPVLFASCFNRGDDIDDDMPRQPGSIVPILALPLTAAALGAVWGALRRYVFDSTEAASATPGDTIVEASKTLGPTAFVILAVAFLVIFGGLAWCFFQAIQAAGGGDTSYPNEPHDDAPEA